MNEKLIGEYKNKFIVDKVLTIDYSYSDQRDKIDYKIIYDYYEYKSGITYKEMMDARVRILSNKVKKIMKNDKLEKYNNQTSISMKSYLDGKKRNRNNYSHLDRNEHEIW